MKSNSTVFIYEYRHPEKVIINIRAYQMNNNSVSLLWLPSSLGNERLPSYSTVQIAQYLFALVPINLSNLNNCGFMLHIVGEVSGTACFSKILQDHLPPK